MPSSGSISTSNVHTISTRLVNAPVFTSVVYYSLLYVLWCRASLHTLRFLFGITGPAVNLGRHGGAAAKQESDGPGMFCLRQDQISVVLTYTLGHRCARSAPMEEPTASHSRAGSCGQAHHLRRQCPTIRLRNPLRTTTSHTERQTAAPPPHTQRPTSPRSETHRPRYPLGGAAYAVALEQDQREARAAARDARFAA